MIFSTTAIRRREELLRDEEMTNSLVVGDREVSQYYMDRKHCQHSHGNDTITGYVLRLTVTNGETLRRGLPDRNGQYWIGYDVDAVDGADQYVEAKRIAESHRPDVVAIDRVYTCGCRIG